MKAVVEEIKTRIAGDLNETMDTSDDAMDKVIEDCVLSHCLENGLGLADIEALYKLAKDEILGFGLLQPLFDDRHVTEIMVNGGTVYYEKDGSIHKSAIVMDDDGLMRTIRSLCRKSGRTVNTASPITDACLGDGTRINIVLSPVSVDGHVLTIRRFPPEPLGRYELIENGFSPEGLMSFLEEAFRKKKNIFICGGAGTGKTTLLNVLANCALKTERIVTIEDSAELQLDKSGNIVRLEARAGNSDGRGRITIRELIRSSLRMRPDRIIVGEVRGEETIGMLQAMNTGHDGSISTGHANSCSELISRLETMVLMGSDIPLKAARKQITTAIDIIVSLSRKGSGRFISQVCTVHPDTEGEPVLGVLYDRFEGAFDSENALRILEKDTAHEIW